MPLYIHKKYMYSVHVLLLVSCRRFLVARAFNLHYFSVSYVLSERARETGSYGQARKLTGIRTYICTAILRMYECVQGFCQKRAGVSTVRDSVGALFRV